MLPLRSLDPDRSVTFVMAPPARPNSASYTVVVTFTVSIASADGISVVTQHALESAQLGFDAVGAVFEIRKGVIARLVGHRRVREVGIDFRDRDRDARKDES